MPTFMMSMNFTDQGIRGIKEAPERAEAARDLEESWASRSSISILRPAKTIWWFS